MSSRALLPLRVALDLRLSNVTRFWFLETAAEELAAATLDTGLFLKADASLGFPNFGPGPVTRLFTAYPRCE